jgi:hypothetical protein
MPKSVLGTYMEMCGQLHTADPWEARAPGRGREEKYFGLRPSVMLSKVSLFAFIGYNNNNNNNNKSVALVHE